jgi:hypothetical protein
MAMILISATGINLEEIMRLPDPVVFTLHRPWRQHAFWRYHQLVRERA